MSDDISQHDERAEGVEQWPPERIEREWLEIQRARATCLPTEGEE